MCIVPHQTGFVGKGSDHILAVPRPREGVCGGAKFFGSAIQPVHSVCVSSERFFISIMKRLCLNISILHRGNVKVRYQNLGEGEFLLSTPMMMSYLVGGVVEEWSIIVDVHHFNADDH